MAVAKLLAERLSPAPDPKPLPACEAQLHSDTYAAAERAFTDYFVRNYPGPNTIIFDPKWHAPKLFSAAARAISDARLTTKGTTE